MITKYDACGLIDYQQEQGMYFRAQKIDEILVIEILSKYFDAKMCNAFIQELEKIELKFEKNKQVVFDIKNIQFIDGSGCRVFFLYQASLKAVGGDLKICNVSQKVAPIFRLTSLSRHFDIYATRKQAIASFLN